ncbi:MAG: radical S-adenosyl methionine domain containing 2 Pfam: Radical, partial [Bacteroidota bacterium]|nr:radical S-adenosyl methionine domain containing 2 Pfam: Radical [Bacteroidota bacterium]
LKYLNFNVVLSTHGRKEKKLFEVAKFCDWVSLPIDGYSNAMTGLMRTDNHPNSKIFNTGNALKSNFKHLKIKIGTVANKKNIQEIFEIGKLLEQNMNCFDTWKIYQYTPRRKHKTHRDSLVISDDEFGELTSLIKERISKDMRIVYSSNEARKNAYTFVYQNGDVNLVNIGDSFGDLLVGNINNFESINFSKIESILGSNHQTNYDITY